MAKQTPRKGMQLFDADETLIGMIAGARGGTISVGGRRIPKGAIARVTQNRAYLKADVATWGADQDRVPAARAVRTVGRPAAPRRAPRAPRTTVNAPSTTVVPLAAERLRTEKRATELGEVRIRKTVVTEERRVPVDLHYERVHVEERDFPDRPATGADLFEEGTIVVPLRGEEAVVSKEAVITGEVIIGKELATERRDVTATVRSEHAEVITRERGWR